MRRDDVPTGAVSGALGRTGGVLRRWTATANRAGDGLWVDLGLYALSAIFAAVTIHSNLAPHREWGSIAAVGYGLASGVVLVQLVRWSVYRQAPLLSRALLTVTAWIATAFVPLVIEAVQRGAGQAGRAQEEVLVIEDGGRRLLETGSPVPEPGGHRRPARPAAGLPALPAWHGRVRRAPRAGRADRLVE